MTTICDTDTIQLSGGHYFNLLEPNVDDIQIEDIAASLSKLCRFTGHCARFYSVAEHSYYASQLVGKQAALQALLHDAAEAYVGDISSPLKRNLPEYRAIEEPIKHAIYEAFGVVPSAESDEEVKTADYVMLLSEKAALMPDCPHDDIPWGWLVGKYDANDDIIASLEMFPMGPEEAEEMFLDAFANLQAGRDWRFHIQ